MRTVFVRAMEAGDKAEALRKVIREPRASDRIQRFEMDPSDFGVVPRSPFAYWVGDGLRGLFAALPALGAEGRVAASGGKTLDDFRWIRAAWELTPAAAARWVGFAKGGAYSQFYADVHLLLDWQDDARSLKEYLVTYRRMRGWSPNWTAELHGSDHYMRPGLTWSRRTQGGLSLRALPAGCIFADKGPATFVPNEQSDYLLALLAVMNGSVFRALVDLQMAFGSYEVGVIQRTPVPRLGPTDQSTMAELAGRAWSLKRSLDTRVEVSHAFVLPALLQVGGESLAARADAWVGRVRAVEAELAKIQGEIDERCFDLYGIDEADRLAISEGLAGDVEGSDAEEPAGEVDEADDEQDVDAAVDGSGLSAELVSWAVGVAFGRFDVRLATGERELPGVPGPFDPLPVCSPGMLAGDDGLPSTSARSGYAVDFPTSGVLVDDPGDGRDLTAAVRAVFETVFAAAADAFWDEAAALLDPRGQDLRAWLRSGFFERHLKLYSKSRRKAPILWQLGTPSGRYSVWLYAQRLSDDSFFQLQGDVLAPKLAYEERQLAGLVQGPGEGASAKERREIEAQEAFVEELRVLLEEVKRVAPLWKPTLDDGIVLVMAPLWRLVPHKAWQRELKKKWAELAAGKYDWAQLAMHLWPERVVPKCAEDRSLAIAHGLENVFWAEDGDGNWQPRQEPNTGVEELIQERTSTAAKDAMRGAA